MPGTPDTPETIIAFDFGLRRIGVAVGQDLTASASPIAAVRNGEAGPDWQAISTIVNEWRPSRLIVGVPMHEDGSRSDMAGYIDEFIEALSRFDLPIDTVDERYSSLEAGELLKSARASGLRGRIKKEAIDSVAAALIAERWLRRTS
ncbi:MAG: Holliday junction resolvase RuvX [Woeseiaceae bacterium]